MRVERPSPDAYPILYDDDGRVLSDPNAEHEGREPEPGLEPSPEEPKPPARSAKKEDWEAYAGEVGIVVEDSDTKDEIIAKLTSVGRA
jgi:hypothetical protein